MFSRGKEGPMEVESPTNNDTKSQGSFLWNIHSTFSTPTPTPANIAKVDEGDPYKGLFSSLFSKSPVIQGDKQESPFSSKRLDFDFQKPDHQSQRSPTTATHINANDANPLPSPKSSTPSPSYKTHSHHYPHCHRGYCSGSGCTGSILSSGSGIRKSLLKKKISLENTSSPSPSPSPSPHPHPSSSSILDFSPNLDCVYENDKKKVQPTPASNHYNKLSLAQRSPLPTKNSKADMYRSSKFNPNHFYYPYVLMGYLQLFFNAFLVSILVYILLQFYQTVKRDVDIKVDHQMTEILSEISQCSKNYAENRCSPGTRVPAMEKACVAWETCMSRDPAIVGRAKVSAITFAEIINSFVEPISYKTMIFFVMIAAGAFVISNIAFSIARSKAWKFAVSHLPMDILSDCSNSSGTGHQLSSNGLVSSNSVRGASSNANTSPFSQTPLHIQFSSGAPITFSPS